MRQQQGFTLIELLIVVAIIGILAAIAVPSFLHARIRAKVAKAVSEMHSILNALEAFYIDNNSYPPMNCGDRTSMKRQYRDAFDKPSTGVIDIAHIVTGTSRDRRIYLTTPIAYITSLLFDPFRGDGKQDSYGYGSDGTSYYIITSWGPDQQDGNSVEELNEWRYTGARLNDLRRGAFREAKLVLREHLYDPSNGTSSAGDIVRVGP